jgi:ubiquinone/menaquinone biosynthesis C-methylase UbiE
MLDVGCGDGAYALAAAEAGARVAGVDASLTAVKAARRRVAAAGLGAAFLVGAASRLPFPSGRFDVVLAVTVLCFVPDPEEAVAEMARVLRPNGLLVLADLGRCSPWAAWRRVRGWAGNATWRRARFWTLRDLRALMRGAGLEPARWRAAAFYPPLALAALLLAPLDAALGVRTTCGAAFLALQGRKRAGGKWSG